MKTYFLFGVLRNEIKPFSHFLGRDLFTISLTTTLHLLRAINRGEFARLMKLRVTTRTYLCLYNYIVQLKMNPRQAPTEQPT